MPRLLLVLILLAGACRDRDREEEATAASTSGAEPAPAEPNASSFDAAPSLDAAPASDETPLDGGGELSWRTDEEAARAEASRAGKRLFVDISAAWCMPCKRLEKETFTDPRVRRVLGERFVPLKLDVTEQTDADRALQRRLGATSLPAILVLSPKGEELRRIETFLGPEELLAELQRLED